MVKKININQIDWQNLDKTFQHLTKEKVIEVIEKYYNGEKISILLSEYNIPLKDSQLCRKFPSFITDKKCTYCGEYYRLNFISRSGYNFLSNDPYCPICGHQDSHLCHCEQCRMQRQIKKVEEERRKIRIINEVYNENRFVKIAEENLDAKERLFICVILRGGLSEDLNYIYPTEQFKEKITPDIEYTNEILKELTDKEILVPHDSSGIDAFIFNDQMYPHKYYTHRVNYRVNIEPYDQNYSSMIDRLMNPDKEIFINDSEFIYKTWKSIALAESLEYLNYSMQKVKFYSFEPGEKTFLVLNNLLKNFSVAQIYYFIFYSISRSSKEYLEGGKTKKHAANSVISKLDYIGGRAIADCWDVKKYGRCFDLPESLISKVFFTTILQMPDIGFYEKPMML